MHPITDAVTKSWERIAPFWPLKNLIAINPLQGFESLPIETACMEAHAYFQQNDLPENMRSINRESIKWLQSFFDEGQATIPMPLRKQGLYQAWRQLAYFDNRLHGSDPKKMQWLANLPLSSETAIADCLSRLDIPREEYTRFLTLLLTTLPGWASQVAYRIHYEAQQTYPVSRADYIAIRIATTCLLWPEAHQLLDWHNAAKTKAHEHNKFIDTVTESETRYQAPLLKELPTTNAPPNTDTPDAQVVFCIDVRSEPFRRHLEAQGPYETFGYAGFFGLPVSIVDSVSDEKADACPVLITPKHTVTEVPLCSPDAAAKDKEGYNNLTAFKGFYQAVKYTFAAPFALVEMLGLACGIWMALRSLSPRLAAYLKELVAESIRPNHPVVPTLTDIPITDQCIYAENALHMIGLTSNFSPLVIFCGHGSSTQNNSYATGLDCGACGGRHGGSNAKILAKILNAPQIRAYLAEKSIAIPNTTHFLAGEHNTTTDTVELYTLAENAAMTQNEVKIKEALRAAGRATSVERAAKLGHIGDETSSTQYTYKRSIDWAQVRPEWGLAGNAAFIIASRSQTKGINLHGRSFLHSYDWQADTEGKWLRAILTAPVVVAQWINAQYLFSTLDNVAYGGGSKVTKNITGKMAIMQGNASDLMNGLPLQSVYKSDKENYHQPLRLLVVVYAPKSRVAAIVTSETSLTKLFGNGWISLVCFDTIDNQRYRLQRDLSWTIR